MNPLVAPLFQPLQIRGVALKKNQEGSKRNHAVAQRMKSDILRNSKACGGKLRKSRAPEQRKKGVSVRKSKSSREPKKNSGGGWTPKFNSEQKQRRGYSERKSTARQKSRLA